MSVVIAARDAAATLPRTLASIRAQTFADYELIVVDDGSSDETGEIARRAGARVLRNDSAQGPAAARNRGIREARRPLIAVVDADDEWLPSFLESNLAVYERAVAAGRRVAVVTPDAELRPRGITWTQRVGSNQHIDLDALLEENLVINLLLGSREAFLSVGGYPEGAHVGAEDYELFIRLAAEGWEIVGNPEVLAIYHLRPDSLTSQVEQRARESAEMFERVLARGGLTRRQRRIAQRRRRVFRVVERRAQIAGESDRRRRAALAARSVPMIGRAVLENRGRWAHWLRRGPRTAGAGRHTGA